MQKFCDDAIQWNGMEQNRILGLSRQMLEQSCYDHGAISRDAGLSVAFGRYDNAEHTTSQRRFPNISPCSAPVSLRSVSWLFLSAAPPLLF